MMYNKGRKITIFSKAALTHGGIVMIKRKIAVICTAACLAFTTSAFTDQIPVVQAETSVTVPGTVLSGTTDTLLYLSTTAGTMEIRIDSNADTSGCKILLPDKQVYLTCYRGSDAYMHAGRIIDNTVSSSAAATVNSTKTITVSGTVTSDTSSQILFLSTSGGIMQIKLDSSTQMNGNVLVVGEQILVTCGSGSDAFLHAISVSAN